MWVVGLTLFVDGMDQYIVRGSSDQIKSAFGVGDTAIGLLFSAFILVNGIVTMPAGYLADRWNRTRAMAVTIVLWSVISAVGGLVPTAAFGLLVVIRASLGFGQAVTDPSGSSVIADYYGTERRGKAFSIQQCLSYVGLGMGLAIGGAIGPLFGGQGWRVAFFVSLFPGLLIAYLCWRLPEPRRGTADRAHVRAATRWSWPRTTGRRSSPRVSGTSSATWSTGCARTSGRSCASRPCAMRWSACPRSASSSPPWRRGCRTSTRTSCILTQQAANGTFGASAILGGIPGTIIGGRIADRWVNRVPGGTGRDPRRLHRDQCRAVHGVVHPHGVRTRLRGAAGRVPRRHRLRPRAAGRVVGRGAGAGARRRVRSLQPGIGCLRFGRGAARHLRHRRAVRRATTARRSSSSCRSPSSVRGCLLLARTHIERDAAKVFEAVVTAMAAQQAEEAAWNVLRRRTRRPAPPGHGRITTTRCRRRDVGET